MRATLFLLLTIGYLIAGLAPFRFSFPAQGVNHARRTDGGYLRAESFGLIRVENMTSWLRAIKEDNQLELRLVVHPLPGRTPPRGTILAISHDSYGGNLACNQFADDFFISIVEMDAYRLLKFPQVFSANDQPVEITLKIIADQLTVQWNGQSAGPIQLVQSGLAGWDETCRVTMLNERGGNSPWLGEIRLAQLDVGGRSRDLLAAADLVIPPRYWRTPRWPQWIPFGRLRSWKHAADPAVNFFGFIPFGLAAAWMFQGRRRFAIAFAAGVGLSLFIEVMQLGIHLRYASTTDVVLNAAGCLVGVQVIKFFNKRGVRCTSE